MRKEYKTVKIPTELATKLDAAVKNLGYTSRAEAVNDAIRRFIESRNSKPETKLENQPPPVQAR